MPGSSLFCQDTGLIRGRSIFFFRSVPLVHLLEEIVYGAGIWGDFLYRLLLMETHNT